MKLIPILLIFACTAFGQCPTPTPPPTVSVRDTSPYSIQVQFNPASPPTTGYMIWRKAEGEDWEIINTGYREGALLDTYEVLPEHTYLYMLQAMTRCNDHTFSEFTPVYSVTTLAGPPPNQNAPAPPIGLAATVANGTVTLRWTAGAFPVVPGQFQTFEVQRSSSEHGVYQTVNFTRQNLLVISGLHGVVWLRVRAFNGFGWATEMYFECHPNDTDCGTAFTNTVSITIL